MFVWWSRQAAAGGAQLSLLYHVIAFVLTNVMQVLDISNITHTLCMGCLNPSLGHQVQSVRTCCLSTCSLALPSAIVSEHTMAFMSFVKAGGLQVKYKPGCTAGHEGAKQLCHMRHTL